MNIKMLSRVPNSIQIIAAMSHSCRTLESAAKGLEKETAQKDQEILVRKILDSGHEGVAEFAWFIFSVDGISRVATHQLVRHRVASYLQMSSRHVDVSKQEIKIPPLIMKNPEALELFKRECESIKTAYELLISLGIRQEDARFLIPDGVCTHISIGMNAREIYHFLGLRLCYDAQWEIRELAEKMLELLIESDPVLFLKVEVSCISSGKCTGKFASTGGKGCPFHGSSDQSKRMNQYRIRLQEFEDTHK